MALTKKEVNELANSFFKENGKIPTVKDIRELNGDSGSFSTIIKYLRKWKNEIGKTSNATIEEIETEKIEEIIGKEEQIETFEKVFAKRLEEAETRETEKSEALEKALQENAELKAKLAIFENQSKVQAEQTTQLMEFLQKQQMQQNEDSFKVKQVQRFIKKLQQDLEHTENKTAKNNIYKAKLVIFNELLDAMDDNNKEDNKEVKPTLKEV